MNRTYKFKAAFIAALFAAGCTIAGGFGLADFTNSHAETVSGSSDVTAYGGASSNSGPFAASSVGSSSAVSSAAAPSPGARRKTLQAEDTAYITPPPFQLPYKMVVGYYGSWAAYSGFTPDKISASNMDVLNYAFAAIGTDLKISVNDAGIDYSNFLKLKALKQTHPNLRTVISVGGWDDSGRFSDAALTDASRSAFADSVVQFVKTYGFDGVDIDWEYPSGGGKPSNVSRTEDKTNFVSLLKALRSRLNKQGILDQKHYILSFAGGSDYSFASRINLAAVSSVVDYGTIMTYDLHGSWEPYTDFNAPLYVPAGQSPQDKTSVDLSVSCWLNRGYPAGKLLLGVPFYGYVYQGAKNAGNGLWQTFSSASAVGYGTIKSKYVSDPSFLKFRENSAAVPWLFNGNTFVSYDDAQSIQLKARYAMCKRLLGVGIWDLAFDKSGTLLKTVKYSIR